MNPKVFIGPMSKNIVDASIEWCSETSNSLGLIPSRRQVEDNGGYVNNWTTKDFSKYVKSKTNKILLVRDHGGPNQGNSPDDGLNSLKEDCKYLDLIHIDVWKKFQDLNKGIEETINLINYCHSLNKNIKFEIGTEQSIREFSPSDLEILLKEVKLRLPDNIFKQIKYAVIQSGTSLQYNINTGSYDKDKLIRMTSIVSSYGLISKEHNGDYLPTELIKNKMNLGLGSINIAPEFGQIETLLILDKIKKHHPDLFEDFYKICHRSKRWVKWVPNDYDPEKNKEEIINITGHYVFSDPNFLTLMSKVNISNQEIKEKIKNKINEISF
jgi:D-tagatose-1,6-bisphosphate aldolase subunit GatZ/KbaZ